MLEQITFISNFLNLIWNILILTLTIKWNWKTFNRSEESKHFYLFSAQNLSPNGIKVSNQIPGCPRHVNVRNLENGSSFLDTLHLTAKEVKYGNTNGEFSEMLKDTECSIVFLHVIVFQVMNCRNTACQGSLMTPKGMTRGTRDGPVPLEELLPQAIDFVNQYYSSFKE